MGRICFYMVFSGITRSMGLGLRDRGAGESSEFSLSPRKIDIIGQSRSAKTAPRFLTVYSDVVTKPYIQGICN
jgi:hypothetical protein